MPATTPRNLRSALALGALVLLIPLAFYLWGAPARRVREIETAPLPRLLALQKERPDDPQLVYRIGLRQHEAGDLAAALASLEKAATLAPDDGAIVGAFAEALADAGQGERAKKTIDALLQKRPESAAGHLTRGSLLRRERNWPEAYAAAKEVTRLDPKNALGWHLLGQAASQTDRLEEAKSAYRRAYEVDPKRWETQLGMGEVLVQDQRHREAIPYFRESARLAPDPALPLLSLSKALLKAETGPLPEAKQALERSLALRPDIPSAYLALGQCLAREGDFRGALHYLERALDLTPDLPEVYAELGKVRDRLGDHAAAERAFARNRDLLNLSQDRRVLADKINRYGPSTPKGRRERRELARAFARAALYDDAAAIYQGLLIETPADQASKAELAAMNALPERKAARAQRAARLLKAGQFLRALPLYRQALAENARDAEAWEGLGVCLAATGDTDGAIPCFLRALRLDPKRALALVSLGEACYGTGFPSAAVRYLERAVQLRPGDAGAWSLLHLALRALPGRGAEAAAARAKALALTPRNGASLKGLDDADPPVGAAIGEADAAAQASLKSSETHRALARKATEAGLLLRAMVEYNLCLALKPDEESARAEKARLEERLQAEGNLPSPALVDALSVAVMPEERAKTR